MTFVKDPLRIAIWSGPRNLSTTLMRSFGARPDTACIDEPFYAAWLATTRARHPMADEIIAQGETDPEAVARALAGPAPGGRPIFYQKHMTHHLLSHFPTGWMAACRHAMLIRDPRRVLASFARKHEEASLEAIGAPQTAFILEAIERETDRTPPVVDSDAILRNPRGVLSKLCAALDISFDEAMLSWPAGARPEDGIWGAHWYDAVQASTGFGPPSETPPALDAHLEEIAIAATPCYGELLARAIQP